VNDRILLASMVQSTHNKALQRTKKEVTIFAKQKYAPSFFAAEL